MKAYSIAKEVGLKHVYVGNIQMSDTEDTFCVKCGKKLIKRGGFFSVSSNKIKDGKCGYCGAKVQGVWSAAKGKAKK
jgi:pyruvate formate lyase activating enzyme